VTPETISDLLLPGGQQVGASGSLDVIRELPGGQQAAEALFRRLTKDGTDVTPSGHPGLHVQMPDRGHIGYRPISRSGPPTIDVNVAGIAIRKLKFPGS
jgi:hypothetical protein